MNPYLFVKWTAKGIILISVYVDANFCMGQGGPCRIYQRLEKAWSFSESHITNEAESEASDQLCR